MSSEPWGRITTMPSVLSMATVGTLLLTCTLTRWQFTTSSDESRSSTSTWGEGASEGGCGI